MALYGKLLRGLMHAFFLGTEIVTYKDRKEFVCGCCGLLLVYHAMEVLYATAFEVRILDM